LRVVNVLHNHSRDRWDRYVSYKRKIRGCPVEPLEVRTKSFDQDLLGVLDTDVNEVFLFHGTTPEAASSIAESAFNVDLAGIRTGMLYGSGIYFAEASSKADEYASCAPSGIYKDLYGMLVTRVVCGNPRVDDKRIPDAEKLREACTEPGRKYHSVVGDRERIRGTYREFVVYDNDAAYPEFVVIYSRIGLGPGNRAAKSKE